jgi:hypothetical protein
MKKRNVNASLSKYWLFLVVCLQWMWLLNIAHSIPVEKIPEPLKPWMDWVLDDHKDRDCPRISDGEERLCAWPVTLELNLNKRSGRFSLIWQIYADGIAPLPGNKALWPQNVVIDGKPALLTEAGEAPAVLLEPGRHQVEGDFVWNDLPEILPVPPNTGLVLLTIDGQKIDFPDLDPGGRLLLKKNEAVSDGRSTSDDRIDFQVFRRIVDEIPMEMLTRIEIRVSGREREILLGPALPEGFIPLNLDSPLPARLNPDGRLRLKLRPGNWYIEVLARNTEDITSLTAGKIAGPWPKEEIWVFEARNQFRLVEVAGPKSIDPRQTMIPEDWKNLPTYRVLPGDILKLKVLRRGDPDPEPNQLRLQRSIWLDFDGAGYTFKDHVTGPMTRGWRLEMTPEIHFGKATVDGVPQFITHMENTEKQGIEVRRGALDLTADCRFERRSRSLPAVGWDQDFVEVGATLHLPPGWEVISIGGTDSAQGTWVSRWTLMDIFMALIVTISFYRMWNWRMGAAALLTMVLVWQEPNSPQYVWLHILAAVALIRVLPEGRFKRVALYYRNIALVGLILIGVPFMVIQVRNGLYPQLENPFKPITLPSTAKTVDSVSGEGMETAQKPLASQMKSARKSLPSMELDSYSLSEAQGPPRIKELDQVDPGARIQTGPGIPQWQWRSVPVRWNGPVKRDQRIYPVLLSPKMTLVKHFLGVVMLLILFLALFKNAFQVGLPFLKNPGSAALILAIGILLSCSQVVKADFPPPEMLNELRTKLLPMPKCFPNCAQIQRMALEIEENTLVVRLEIHALAAVGAPLPGKAGQWLPNRVLDAGADARGLYRMENGQLWIQLDEGIHQVVMAGPLPMNESVQLPLPLKPRHVSVAAKKWLVRGVDENGIPDDQLLIERIRESVEEKAAAPVESIPFMPFVKIERNLLLGLDWRIENRVIRTSYQNTAVVIEVPLLPGESVMTPGFSVKEGKVLINMGPNQRFLAWESSMQKQSKVTLSAPRTLSWVEIWRTDISTLWHAEVSGLNPVHHQDPSGRWFPEWRPWPGESLTLTVFKPTGAKGQTLTIDDSRMEVKPGIRAVDARLSLTLNSSQGGQHSLTLPEKAELQSVSINGSAQPIRQKGRDVTLPIVPGKQTISLSLQAPGGISGWYKTPSVDLGIPGVNHSIEVEPGANRWILWTTGPRMGPAVLFWGVLIVIFLIAAILGRTRLTPLKTWQWLLLGIGLSQTSAWVGLIVVGWFFALSSRKNIDPERDAHSFNMIQLGLGVLTAAAMAALFVSVQKGLLGLPEMQISGNRSTAFALNWFADRVGPALPKASILSLPLAAYRIAMLLWALWLAFSLVGWLRWGWNCCSIHGFWRKMPPRAKKTAKKRSAPDSDFTATQSNVET